MQSFGISMENWLRKGRQSGGEEERAGYSQLPEVPDDFTSTSTAGESSSTYSARYADRNNPASVSVSQKKGTKSTGKQLGAILRKNLTLKMKSRRSACGCTIGGIPGLIFELFLPSLLILLLSIPKIFLNPIQFPTLRTAETDTFKLQSAEWLQSGCPNTTVTPLCANPVWQQQWDSGNVLFSPNTTLERDVIDTIVKDISCPKVSSFSFFFLSLFLSFSCFVTPRKKVALSSVVVVVRSGLISSFSNLPKQSFFLSFFLFDNVFFFFSFSITLSVCTLHCCRPPQRKKWLTFICFGRS